MSLTVSVIVPTWRRPADLRRCLDALADQARAADEVLVIHRAEDAETLRVLEQAPTGLALRRVVVEAAGQVAALNRGLEEARGGIIAITDDDAAPRPDWLRRIVETFERDPTLTGLGGRDWLHIDGRLATGERRQVGRVQAWGRCIGNHHLGAGAPREVDILKGANMSFRHVHLGGRRFDVGLKGEGAQCATTWPFAWRCGRPGGGWSMTRPWPWTTIPACVTTSIREGVFRPRRKRTRRTTRRWRCWTSCRADGGRCSWSGRCCSGRAPIRGFCRGSDGLGGPGRGKRRRG